MNINIPNVITLGRLISVPIIFWLLLTGLRLRPRHHPPGHGVDYGGTDLVSLAAYLRAWFMHMTGYESGKATPK